MPFPQRFMDELLDRSDIVDIVSGYVRLTPRGGEYWACCPFHSEKTASFHIVPDKQMYYCFGCKKGGGVVNFIMEEENLSYPDAVRFLARRAGMRPPEYYGESRERSNLRERLLRLNRDAARFYFKLLQGPEGQPVREYLNRRRIFPRTAVRFGMGASPFREDALLSAMTEKGYSKQDLMTAGLVVESKQEAGRLRDKFRGRLILPVIDEKGDVVGFGSRVLDKSEPKYMNSPDTPVYSKKHVLYGLNLAKKTKRKNIILCEGNLDVVTLHQAGFDNAVASMGTALTEKQVQLLSRATRELILCFDNDSAGKTATERALKILNSSNLPVRVLQLPRQLKNGEYVKQDPDDYIKQHGPDAFEALLSGSSSGTDFRLQEIAGKYDLKNDRERLAFSQEAGELIASLRSAVERTIYTRRAAELADVPEAVMEADAQRAAKQHYAKERRDERRQELNPSIRIVQPEDRTFRYANVRSARAEEGVIRLLLRDDSLFSGQPPLSEEQFSAPLYGKTYSALMKARSEGRPASMNTLSAVLTPEEMSQIAAVCQKPESMQNAGQALSDYIRVIREESSREETDPLLAQVERAARYRADKTAPDRQPEGDRQNRDSTMGGKQA